MTVTGRVTLITSGDFRKYINALTVLCALCFFAAVSAVSAETNSSVWSVTKDSQTLYIGGTMHLLKRSDYPLPRAFDTAYAQAETLVFETDIAAINSLEVQARLSAMMMLPPGQTLSGMLSAQTYGQLGTYLKNTGLPIEQFERVKPAMVALIITVMEMQKLGLGEAGVDQYYHAMGQRDGKNIGWVESVDAHLAYVAGMGEGDEDAFLKYSLLDLANLEPMMDELNRMWREGDLEGLDVDMLQPMRSQFPEVYHSLIVERNNNWLPQIEAMADTPEIEFILVGAGHLAGEDGVLQKLQAKGYKVKRLGGS
jgi:uncharacterized protein